MTHFSNPIANHIEKQSIKIQAFFMGLAYAFHYLLLPQIIKLSSIWSTLITDAFSIQAQAT